MMKNFEKTLHKQLYRGDCPSAETLHHYYWGDLSAELVPQMTNHIEICPDCANEYAQMVTFLMPERKPAEPTSLREKLQVIVARLSPVQANPAFIPMANDESSERSSLMFETNTDQIIFINWWQNENATYTVTGTIFPPPTALIENGVQLMLEGEVFSADLPPDSDFQFSELRAGRYTLMMTVGDDPIFIPNVEIAASR